MPKCSICKINYEFPDGLTFVHVDGRVLHFCSSKCRKNHEMGRKKLKWVTKQKGIDKTEVEEEAVKEKAEAKEKPAEKKEEKKAEAKPKEESKAENKEEKK
ncbi:hypothetical protein HYT26_02390 [Candidatus Pacearchaeota archaeon]|nr:hypothetical protein [Candidatus Pacearchaeota archaeon]